MALGQAVKAWQGKRSSLFRLVVGDEGKKFNNVDTCGQCYKNFYSRNLRMFVISQSVCAWQVLPAYLNVFRYGQEPTQELAPERCFSQVGYPSCKH